MGRQLGLGPLEVVGLHVGAGSVVLERLDQDVLLSVLQVARPVEPEVAGLGAGGLGEAARDLGPVVGVLGQDPEPGGDEDHGLTLTQRSRSPAATLACVPGREGPERSRPWSRTPVPDQPLPLGARVLSAGALALPAG